VTSNSTGMSSSSSISFITSCQSQAGGSSSLHDDRNSIEQVRKFQPINYYYSYRYHTRLLHVFRPIVRKPHLEDTRKSSRQRL
jgi:hypothetical protein